MREVLNICKTIVGNLRRRDTMEDADTCRGIIGTWVLRNVL
jgi:hypothetical protein